MKKKFDLVVGIYAVYTLLSKLFTCPSCEDRIFGFTVSGTIYMLFWGVIAVIVLNGVYQANSVKAEH